jgi:threonylcarbamoyladenosine tRNA methylthiotransferase MtaB
MRAMGTKRAALHTLGCRVNQAETAILGEGLRRKGYRLVDVGEPTDLLVLNTCAVTEDAERTSRYLIRKTLKHSPHAFVAVTGCYAQTGVETLRRHGGIDLIVGNQYKLELPDYLPPHHELGKRQEPELRYSKTIDRHDFVLPYYGEPDCTRAPLKIQDGCGDMCSFCIIPFARGHGRSRKADDILREAEDLVAHGFRELVLTGINIGRYLHNGMDLCGLLNRLESISGLARIRISSIEPTTVNDALLDRMAASGKICHYLHIPLQSGDDGILESMNRRHRVCQYVALVERALRAMPGLGLGTDLMPGFPGETEGQFANTLGVATDLPFSYIHVFPYSHRPGTAAARLRGRVAPTDISRRSAILQRLSRTKRLFFHQKHIGRTLPVLFEGSRDSGLRFGTTDNFMRIGVESPLELRNRIETVTVTAVSDQHAFGQLTYASTGRQSRDLV